MVIVGGTSQQTLVYHEGKICLGNVESVLPDNMTRMEVEATWFNEKIVYCGGTPWTNECVALTKNSGDKDVVGGEWNTHSEMVYIRRWFSLTAMPDTILDYYDYEDDSDNDDETVEL